MFYIGTHMLRVVTTRQFKSLSSSVTNTEPHLQHPQVLRIAGVADIKEGKDLGRLCLLDGYFVARGGWHAAHAHANIHAVVVRIVGGDKVVVYYFVPGPH